MSKRPWKCIGVSFLTGVPFAVFALWSAGFGHGTYVPLAVFFPYTTLIMLAVATLDIAQGSIGDILLVLGFLGLMPLQFITYGLFILWGRERQNLHKVLGTLAVSHIAAVAGALYFMTVWDW